MRRRARLLVCTFTLASALVATAVAQEPPEAVVATPAAPPIAVADIVTRADTDERFAEGVARRSAAPDPTAQLSPELDTIAASVDENLTTLGPQQLRQLPVMRLESLVRHWRFAARRFERWQADMRLSVAVYAADAAELARRRGQWEVTRAARDADDIPAALQTRVDTVIAALRQAELNLSLPLARQIDLQRRASVVDERIQSGQRAVLAAIDEIDSQLLRLDSVPLWTMSAQTGDSTALSSVMPGLQIEVNFARAYSAANMGNQRALRVWQILLLPLLLWLSLRNRRLGSAADSHPASARVLKRPFASWLLLATMGVLAFEPDAPLILHHVAMLIAIVPTLRLLPPASHRLLNRWPYVAATLYLLQGLGYVTASNPLLYRIFILAQTMVALALLLWLLWRARHVVHERLYERIHRGIRVAALLSVVLLVISAVSNVLGNVSLAEMLTAGVIDSGYLALMLYAGINVIIALLHWLLTLPNLAHTVRKYSQPLLGLLIRLLALAGIVGWLIYMMQSFRVLRPVYTLLQSVLSRQFSFGDISISLGHVLLFVVSVLVAFWVARIVRALLREEVLARLPLARGVGNSIASLTYYVVLILGWVLALSAAGFKTSQLVLVFGALGVGIGFGLQNVVNNFVSGLILMFERPVQPGDVVEVSGTSGRVWNIGMRATTIRTFEGADVVVPNGALLSGNLTNWTLLDRSRRFDINVGVVYGSKPVEVVEILSVTASETPGVAAQPAPEVLFMNFGDSALNFSVRAWTDDFDAWVNIRSDMVTRIYAALEKANIQMPYPQRDLHLRSVSPDVAAALTGR